MKKLTLISLLAIGLLSFNFSDTTTVTTSKENTSLDCKYGQCKAIAKSTKKRCKHCVSNSGDSYCYQHK